LSFRNKEIQSISDAWEEQLQDSRSQFIRELSGIGMKAPFD
jgi:hypothetical protein